MLTVIKWRAAILGPTSGIVAAEKGKKKMFNMKKITLKFEHD